MLSVWNLRKLWRWSTLTAACVALCAGPGHANARAKAQSAGDWVAQVKERVSAHDLAAALKIVDAELAAAPNDSDALGWRAQLLAWTGHRAEAEEAFCRALELSPRDADYMLGLATLEARDGQNADALELLDKALEIPPRRADVYNERGRVLAALQRRKEAREDFVVAQTLEPANIAPADNEAAAGLRSLQGKPRYEVDFTNETDTFNYTNAANTQTFVFVAKPNDRWGSYERSGLIPAVRRGRAKGSSRGGVPL